MEGVAVWIKVGGTDGSYAMQRPERTTTRPPLPHTQLHSGVYESPTV